MGRGHFRYTDSWCRALKSSGLGRQALQAGGARGLRAQGAPWRGREDRHPVPKDSSWKRPGQPASDGPRDQLGTCDDSEISTAVMEDDEGSSDKTDRIYRMV